MLAANVMTEPSSLRDLYIDPASAWAFVPTGGSAPVPPPPPMDALTTTTYQWSTRPSHNSVFDLSPSLDLSEPSGINAVQLLKAFAASAVLQYTSTAIVMPWEVGKLLLQVQWVPRDAGEPEMNVELEYEDNEDAVSRGACVESRILIVFCSSATLRMKMTRISTIQIVQLLLVII